MNDYIIKQFVCFPNLTELGQGNTHDRYLRVSSPLKLSIKSMFPLDQEFNVEDENTHKLYTLKLTSGSEYRIIKLGKYYDDYNIQCGDEIIFTNISSSNNTKKYIRVVKHKRLIFIKNKDFFKIIGDINLLDSYNQGNYYELQSNNEKITISLPIRGTKRIDSPTETDFYSVSSQVNSVLDADFYIDMDDPNFQIHTYKKDEFGSINIQNPQKLFGTVKQNINNSIELPLQQIFYGAPGTGKSHSIKDKTKGCEVIRTTFHPDSDYSTFVGSYKPTSKENDDDVIVYRFVAQAFLQAYTSAWKKYGAANNSTDPEKVFLVIEEINRGNCAQIFGDLFQLLDRNDYGFSDYPIKADADMKKQLSNSFNGLNIVLSESINNFYDEKDTISKVISGDILLIPNNLYIWATMNTSDQSLFPIDSAFKRRWNWNYIPIANANLGWKIQIENDKYDWWDFLVKINSKIGETTNSEDKKLGYFFCKARNNVISEHAFVNKVIFYLWNDVFKDYDFDDTIFNDENGSKLSFDKFYTVENNITKIDSTKIKTFLTNLNVSNLTELATSDSMQSEDMQN